jgi:hypothetical protein
VVVIGYTNDAVLVLVHEHIDTKTRHVCIAKEACNLSLDSPCSALTFANQIDILLDKKCKCTTVVFLKEVEVKSYMFSLAVCDSCQVKEASIRPRS